MRKIGKKQLIVGGVAVAVIAAGAGTALAYWSTTGSGGGSATTSSGNGHAVQITDNSSSLSPMYPGDSAQTVTVTVTNSDASQKAYVAGVSAYLTVTPTAGNTCDATDYKLNGVAGVTSANPANLTWTGEELAASAHDTTSYTLQFNNKSTLQDGCKGAAVAITYASN
jgi:hypothetical protein